MCVSYSLWIFIQWAVVTHPAAEASLMVLYYSGNCITCAKWNEACSQNYCPLVQRLDSVLHVHVSICLHCSWHNKANFKVTELYCQYIPRSGTPGGLLLSKFPQGGYQLQWCVMTGHALGVTDSCHWWGSESNVYCLCTSYIVYIYAWYLSKSVCVW